jgi:hypothetical protein
MPELGSYGSNGMDRPRSSGASVAVEEKRIVNTWYISRGGALGSGRIVARHALVAVKPSPSAHRDAAVGLTA